MNAARLSAGQHSSGERETAAERRLLSANSRLAVKCLRKEFTSKIHKQHVWAGNASLSQKTLLNTKVKKKTRFLNKLHL